MEPLFTRRINYLLGWYRISLLTFIIFLTGIYSTIAIGQTWINKNPSSYPDARTGHKLSYLTDNKILLFGGINWDGVDLNDTWIYDVTANFWQKLSPAIKPSARRSHAMANIGNNKVLMFGGVQGTPSYIYNDTWLFDGINDTWSLLSPASKPAVRYSSAMAYMGDDKVLLFGGSSVGSSRPIQG